MVEDRNSDDNVGMFTPKETPLNFGYIQPAVELPHQHAGVSQSLRTCDQSKVGGRGRCQAAVTTGLQVEAQPGL